MLATCSKKIQCIYIFSIGRLNRFWIGYGEGLQICFLYMQYWDKCLVLSLRIRHHILGVSVQVLSAPTTFDIFDYAYCPRPVNLYQHAGIKTSHLTWKSRIIYSIKIWVSALRLNLIFEIVTFRQAIWVLKLFICYVTLRLWLELVSSSLSPFRRVLSAYNS